MIDGGQQSVIIARHLFMLRLQPRRFDVLFVHGGLLGGRRLSRAASRAAVVTHIIIDDGSVDYGVVYVGVVDHGGVHIRNSRFEVEGPAAPFSPNEPDAAVTVAIVNPAIKADMGAPVSGVPK